MLQNSIEMPQINSTQLENKEESCEIQNSHIENIITPRKVSNESLSNIEFIDNTINDILGELILEAGEFDEASVEDKIEEAIASAPCGE